MSQLFSVFFFEDEQEVADRVKGYLERPPIRTSEPVLAVDHYVHAKDAFEAIEQWKTPPDVALLDVIEEGYTSAGLDLCRVIKEGWPRIPVIFLSDFSSVRDQILGYDAQATVYLSKALIGEPNYGEQIRTVLLAQIKNIQDATEFDPTVYQSGSLEVDMDAAKVCWRGKQLALSYTDMGIVDELAKPQNEGRLCKYESLAVAGGLTAVSAGQRKVNVKKRIERIRRAFERVDEGFKAAWQGGHHGIIAVASVGYRWVTDDSPKTSQ